MFAWVGQLRALWDLAGDLVEVRERLDLLNEVQGEYRKELDTINERTRKQVYREKKETEDLNWATSQGRADPVVDRQAILRAARAKGMNT